MGAPPSAAAGPEGKIARPPLPSEKESVDCDMETLMKDIRRWCVQELPAALGECPGLMGMCKESEFWQCRPLAIGETDKGSLVGHKEPYDQNKCSVAMAQKGMYEASMNIDWLRPFPQGTTARQIMGDLPTLAEVRRGAESWFDYSGDPNLASSQDKTKKVFPTVLAAYVDSVKALERQAFPQSLLLLDGFVYTWAWWLHMYTILEDFVHPHVVSPHAALRLHLDIGLSVTVHMRVETDSAELAKWAMERGSQKTVTKDIVETDSFAAFVQRAAVFLEGVEEKQRQKALTTANVHYAGSPVSRQMFFAIQACLPLAVGPGAAPLERLQREFGRDCFTKGYTKMYLLSRMCAKVGIACKVSVETLFKHCLQGLLFELRYELLRVEDMTVPRLQCTRGGNSGKFGVLLWKSILSEAVFAVARQAASDSGGALQAEAEQLEADFGSYEAFENKFQSLATPQDALDLWKQNKRKAVAEAADFLNDVYGCVYDDALAAMNIEESKDPAQVDWNSVKGLEPYDNIVRLFRSAGTAVSCSAAEDAPAPNKRTLTRYMSDPVYEDARQEEVQRERQETWRKATVERKTLVTFSVCKQWTKDKLRTHLASLVAAKEFKGVIGSKHRILFGSCDLLAEDGGETPWKDGVAYSDTIDTMVTAILESSGATDTAVVFDGGSGKVRRRLEVRFEDAAWKNVRQVTLVYDSSRSCRNPKDWKRVYGNNNLETGCVATRFRSNKWTVQKREKYTLGEEGSSAGSVFANVPVRTMASLPTMAKHERAAMTFKEKCPSPAAGIFDVEARGHPFSWTEWKPLGWYEVFLPEVRAALVVDYSPGSGAMARACLDLGIQYVGICRTDQHCSWLTNILNTAAVECISRNGSPLYQQDLATCINDHFRELIDELHQQDAAVEAESDGEESGESGD